MLRRHADASDGQLPGASNAPAPRRPARLTGRRALAARLAVVAVASLIAATVWLPPFLVAEGARAASTDHPAGSGPAPGTTGSSPELRPVAGVESITWEPGHITLTGDDDEVAGLLVAAELGPTPAPDRFARHHVPVLTYHVIAPWASARAYSTADLDVSPERFEAHLRVLRDAGWRTITAEGLAQALATDRVPPARTVVITIDDGFADGFVNALPVLQRYGFIATFYVVPGRLGEPNHLSWDQVRELAAAGMEIGNHTQGHVPLTQRRPAEAARQILDAQTAIEREIGQAPTTFAYPFGDFNVAVASAVEAAGLSLAFTTRGGTTETWATRFTLPRIHVGATLLPESLLRLVEGFQ